jgi:hypothetical protein
MEDGENVPTLGKGAFQLQAVHARQSLSSIWGMNQKSYPSVPNHEQLSA